MLPRTFRRYHCVFAALLLMQGSAAALTLDWDTAPSLWPDGDLIHSYDIDPGNAGDDITIEVTRNNGAPLVTYLEPALTPLTPTVNAVFEGGLGSVQGTLTLAVNLTDSSTQSITITVYFAHPGGVTDVSFQLFDIDQSGPSQDQLTLIHGTSSFDGSDVAPFITVPTPGDNLLLGSGTNQSVRGTAPTASKGGTSGRGNVTINFGSNALQSFTFTFGSNIAFGNPAYQQFGIHDINFTPVPEINPALISVLSCLAAGGFVLRHRAKLRK